ncbi:MAG: hypothetical protein U0326_21410 [Polyangiales bacterium]
MNARRATPSLLLVACLFGCSTSSSTPDATAPDVVNDTASDNTPADLPVTDGSADVATDTASDAQDAAADAPDAPVVTFSAMTTITAINQNCMPAVPRDPLSIMGSIALTNTGTVPIGPITLTTGLVVRLLGGDTLATFGVTPATLAAVAPRQTGTVTFTKAADTLGNDAGTAGCEIVPCGTPVRISIPLSGTNVPDGTRAASEPMTIPCTH